VLIAHRRQCINLFYFQFYFAIIVRRLNDMPLQRQSYFTGKRAAAHFSRGSRDDTKGCDRQGQLEFDNHGNHGRFF
jgi:hypothetical protein